MNYSKGLRMPKTLSYQIPPVPQALDTSETGYELPKGPIVINVLRREGAYNFLNPITIDMAPTCGKTEYRVAMGGNAFRIVSEQDFFKEVTSETKGSYFSITMLALRFSQKLTFREASNLFDVKNVDRNIKLKDFRNLRKKQYIPIEDYIFRERYE